MARGEWEETARLIGTALNILKDEHPMTIRQLFYRLVSVNMIYNTRADYQRISRVMTKAREDGRVDYDFIVDRSRPEYAPNVFEDLAGYGRAIKRSYRKDYWALQPNYVELWCEKDSVIGSIEELTEELGISVRVGRGFQSTTRVHEIAQRFLIISKPIHVFFAGDFDPSGVEIEDDVARRVFQHMMNDDPDADDFYFSRLAIFASDIKTFKLPPLRIKDSDSRADRFRKMYGKECVELDALPPSELRRRIRAAVEDVMDTAAWDHAVKVEQAELASIHETISKWPGAMNG